MSATTWVAGDATVERVALGEDSWVDVVRGLVPRADAVHDELASLATWEQGRIFRYERLVPEPRLFGRMPDGRHHPAVVEATQWLQRQYRVPFAGAAIARYRDERDGVGFHRDREMRWLEETVIGVLTLGAQRPFLLRPLTGRRIANEDDDLADAIDLHPASGDLLVMGGRCQAAWLHAVPKVRTPRRSRISLQWRWTSRRGRRDPNPTYSAPRHFSRR